jgi:hypothetical protein
VQSGSETTLREEAAVFTIITRVIAGVAASVVAAAVAVAAGSSAVGSPRAARATTTTAPTPPPRLVAHRLHARPWAIRPGSRLKSPDLVSERVFPTARVGFALANDRSAQYPALSTDGGRSWRLDGPQLHIDAADGAEAVSFVGAAGPRTFFAYGSSVVDVTTDGGRSWWETYAGELVISVVPGLRPGELIAFVQQSPSAGRSDPVVTWQYVTRDGGQTWTYSTRLAGFA